MKNKLSDLNNYLFESIERLMEDDLSNEEMDRELKRSAAITNIAETIIHNGELALKTMKHVDEYGINNSIVPKMLVLE